MVNEGLMSYTRSLLHKLLRNVFQCAKQRITEHALTLYCPYSTHVQSSMLLVNVVVGQNEVMYSVPSSQQRQLDTWRCHRTSEVLFALQAVLYLRLDLLRSHTVAGYAWLLSIACLCTAASARLACNKQHHSAAAAIEYQSLLGCFNSKKGPTLIHFCLLMCQDQIFAGAAFP